MAKTFGSAGFDMGTVSYGPKQILKILSDNQQAYMKCKQAKSNCNTVEVLKLAGGFLVGFPIGPALVDGDPQ